MKIYVVTCESIDIVADECFCIVEEVFCTDKAAREYVKLLQDIQRKKLKNKHSSTYHSWEVSSHTLNEES